MKTEIKGYCPHCRQEQILLAYIQEKHPLSTRPERHVRDCAVCGNTWTIDPETGAVRT